jgi:hypothetical protein
LLNDLCIGFDQHLRQLDPTEIIAIPYNLERLSIYVAMVVLVVLFDAANNRGRFTQKCSEVIQLSGMSWIVFILCGASPTQNVWHTVLAAMYCAILVWFDPPVFDHVMDVRNNNISNGLRQNFLRRFQGKSISGPQDVVATTILNSTIAFTIPLQILLLYDRGWQIQRWPVPVIIGSTIGWVVGTILGTILAITSFGQQKYSYKRETMHNR